MSFIFNIPDCGGHQEARTLVQQLLSPGYPKTIASAVTCVYTIAVEGRSMVDQKGMSQVIQYSIATNDEKTIG
jgi:hypothetical protein